MTQANQISAVGGAAPPFVDDYLLYLLAAASHALSAKYHAMVKEQGISVNEWRVLACLVDRPGLMLTELAGFVLFEQSHLTKVIDRMVAQGLVGRAKTNDDRRKVLIQITQKGRELVTPLIAAAKNHEAMSSNCLDQQELTAFKRTLKKLIRFNG